MLPEKSKNLQPLWIWELCWYFLCQSKSNSLLERRTPKQKLWAVVTHFPSLHKPFSETAQKEMDWNYLGHRKKANPWKGSQRAILRMGSAGPPKSFKKEGKCIIRNNRQYSRWEVCGRAGHRVFKSCRKGCFNPLPHSAAQGLTIAVHLPAGFLFCAFSFLLAPTQHLGRSLQTKGVSSPNTWDGQEPGFYPSYTQVGLDSLPDKTSFLGSTAEFNRPSEIWTMLSPLGHTHGLEQQSFIRWSWLLVKTEALRVCKASKSWQGRDSSECLWGLDEFWGSDSTKQRRLWNPGPLSVGGLSILTAVKLKYN